MAQDLPTERHPKISPTRRVLSTALTLAGVALFVHLVVASGFTWRHMAEVGWLGLCLLLLASASTRIVNAVAWRYTLRHVSAPSLIKATAFSVAGFSLTDALPGGFVLGEWFKMEMLRRWYGVQLSDAAASQLIIKFGLALSHCLFVLAGLVLSYPVLRDHSLEVFGSSGAHLAFLLATVVFGLLLLVGLFLVFGGRSFSRLAAGLGRVPAPSLRRWLAQNTTRAAELDQRMAVLFHGNRKNVITSFGFLAAGWLLQALETAILLRCLGLSDSFTTAFAIEAVGSIARLILFVLPSGIGAQDAVFVALFKSYGLYGPASGAFLLAKRAKDLLWIGVGFLFILLVRRGPRGTRPT
jgi:hypothetical protein